MKAVVFDMDGVIFDSERLAKTCWMEIGDERGIQNFSYAFDQIIGLNYQAEKDVMCGIYGEDFPFDDIYKEAGERKLKKCLNGHYPLKSGIVELLAFLKENEYKVGLASSTSEDIVRMHITNAGLLPYFDCLICGNMVKNSKPDPEIFLLACKTLNVLPEETYIIEDSYNGIRAAHSAGAFTIMVPDLKMPTEEMRELSDLILEDLYEVQEELSYVKKNKIL